VAMRASMPFFFMSATALGWFNSISAVSLIFQCEGIENYYNTPPDPVNGKGRQL
jgi:hypothetical protein